MDLTSLNPLISKYKKLKNIAIILAVIGAPFMLIMIVGSKSAGKLTTHMLMSVVIFAIMIIFIIANYYSNYKPIKVRMEELEYDIAENQTKTMQVNICGIILDSVNGYFKVANKSQSVILFYEIKTIDGQTFYCNNLPKINPNMKINFMASITYYENSKVITKGEVL